MPRGGPHFNTVILSQVFRGCFGTFLHPGVDFCLWKPPSCATVAHSRELFLSARVYREAVVTIRLHGENFERSQTQKTSVGFSGLSGCLLLCSSGLWRRAGVPSVVPGDGAGWAPSSRGAASVLACCRASAEFSFCFFCSLL